MQNTTLCYLEHQGQYLMLLRNKKKHDINKQKWIGIGGHLLEKETPDECVQREFTEETGLTLLDYKLRGLVTFISDEYETVQMWLYTASKFEGELKPCDEGELHWIDIDNIQSLNLWEGDLKFLELIKKPTPFFTMKLSYQGEILVEYKVQFH